MALHPTALAVERYHELLSQQDVTALWQSFREQMAQNLLFFGDRPICNVLRPHFLHPAEFAHIAEAAQTVLSALHKVYQAVRTDRPGFREALHLSSAELALLQMPDFFGAPDASARMDAFWLPGERLPEGRLTFLEYNADTPGGLIYGDVLTDLFRELPVMQEFSREYRLHTTPIRQRVVQTLMGCYRDWAQQVGRTTVAAPTVAIVDWRTVRTRNEFVLVSHVLQEQGSRVVICDPEDLTFRDGRLWAGIDLPIDIVYKRVVVDEFITRYPDPAHLLAHPLTQAVSQRAVCMVNGFNCQILYNKGFFALLSDEAHWSLFNAREQAAVRQHVPWTRLVTERRTRLEQQEIDLIPFIQQNRDDLVLKPIKAYGGTGVVLGWEVDQQEWDRALTEALVLPSIVQRRVLTPRALFPIWQDGLHYVNRMVDVSPYIWRGEYVSHAGVRLSANSLLNVSAGGGSATPLFLVEKSE